VQFYPHIEHIVGNLNQCFMIFIVFIYTKSVSARFLRVRAPRRTSKSSLCHLLGGWRWYATKTAQRMAVEALLLVVKVVEEGLFKAVHGCVI
jgi:hypothetical protein